MPSWARMHRARIFTSFASAMVDRAFAITCWISLLHLIPSTGQLHVLQYLTMTTLVVMEGVNGCNSFYKFLTTHLVSPPHTEDIDFSNSPINVVQLRKTKQTFEFVGMALFILPFTRYLGLALVALALPMEYELGREQTRKRVLYYAETGKSFDHQTLKGWMQMKSLASKLIVGVSRRDAMDMVMNACAANTVDEVIVEAPTKVDLLFLEKKGIDFVITSPGQSNVVTDEVVIANRVLILGEHGHLRRVQAKPAVHKD
uniref:Uncharacterized protein n=2 Tax=Amphora coffeiformis TaxID=265554 RepID=A0A7S3P4Q0_9STRA|mmetsp:Transcript_5425/g.10503  ORF Transcript_5425/g.10503 Transcript_5425/m.10503 type:complete len:258 (+) Transcript_5425:787-1560(+)